MIGKPLTQYLKILRHQNEWRSFGKTEFQAALNALDLSDEDQNIINQTFIGDLAAMMKGV